jgi:alpha-L-fucosidase 2
MKWKNGRVVSLTIRSTLGGNLRIRSTAPLKGKGVMKSKGINSNQLMQVYEIPVPKAKDASKLIKSALSTTYLYDVPTKAGGVITLRAN